MYYVYVLENPKGRHYIGSCEDIEKRLKEHNRNSVRSTKNRGPFRLVYKENLFSCKEARKREMQLKSYKSSDYLRKKLGINKTPSSSLV